MPKQKLVSLLLVVSRQANTKRLRLYERQREPGNNHKFKESEINKHSLQPDWKESKRPKHLGKI